MHDAEFLKTLALVLCVAAVTTIVFQKLRQPVVFGYLLAGMIIGPAIPVPIVADEEMVRMLSELGVILLMFGLGLEFNMRRLIQVGSVAALIAIAETTAMVWLGFTVGQLMGWTALESFYAGAIIAISSTTVIAKALGDQRERTRAIDLVFGILIVEDLIAILVLAVLTTVSAGNELSLAGMATTASRLIFFLAALIGVGVLILPRLTRYLVKLDRPETTTVASIGISFAAALLALSFGYSVALGAFIAGSLVAESGEGHAVEKLITPVRDIFVAVFFVAVGMLINPTLIAQNWPAVLALTLAVIFGKVVAVSASSFFMGNPVRTSVQAGMTVAQIGEFSFMIAALGAASGATRSFLYPVAIAVSAITTLTTPWLIRASGPVASRVDARLPHRLQTFVALYGSWLSRIRQSPGQAAARSKARRIAQFLLLDVILLAVVVIGASTEMDRVRDMLRTSAGLSDEIAGTTVLVIALAVGIPLLIGAVRSARQLGLELALRALPSGEAGKVDLAAAPRRVLVVTLQLGIVLLVGVPLVALTQPFLPPLRGAAVLVAVVAILSVTFWRSATNLHGHARAGAELIVSVLSQQMATVREKSSVNTSGESNDQPSLAQVDTFLPGLGEPKAVMIDTRSIVRDRQLAELDLRGQTGATVLAIMRSGEPVLIPDGHDVLRAGDIVALAGSDESVEAAKRLLSARNPAEA